PGRWRTTPGTAPRRRSSPAAGRLPGRCPRRPTSWWSVRAPAPRRPRPATSAGRSWTRTASGCCSTAVRTRWHTSSVAQTRTADGAMTELETRFVRPPQAVLATLVSRALTAAGETTSPADCTWVEHGSNTVVALGERTAVRIGRHPSAAADLLRSQALVDALADLPFDVPRSTGDPVEADGHLAIPTRRLSGVSDPPDPPDAVVLRDLLEAVHSADLHDLRAYLAPPRSFFGGEHWQQVLTDRVVPLLPIDLRA